MEDQEFEEYKKTIAYQKFEEGLEKKWFSENEEDPNWIGYFMYMGVAAENESIHIFKHHGTRKRGWDKESILATGWIEESKSYWK